MKRFLILTLVVLMLFPAGCNTVEQSQSVSQADFKFCSVEWGSDWETVQEYEAFEKVNTLKDNGNRKTVRLEKGEFLDVPIGDVGLVFDSNGIGDTSGLLTVIFQFEEEHEKTLLTKLEEAYGVRKSTYKDKNGVDIPINPAGWVSDETIEDVLTEDEKAYYISLMPKNHDQSRIDAMLRSPLVSIRFDEQRNTVEFNGGHSAVVKYIKSEMIK